MKTYLIFAVIAFACMLVSCKKDHWPHNGGGKYDFPTRKVRFELYTKENFAGDRKNIHFNVFMRTERKTILDSALEVMKVEEIPDSLHKIVIEKLVPNNDTARLAVGFTYQIDNVGLSWYLEEFPASDTFKLLRYSFK